MSLKSRAHICCLHLIDLGVMSSVLGYPLAPVLFSLSSCPQQVSQGCLAGPAVKAVFSNSLNQKSHLKAGGLSLTFQIFYLAYTPFLENFELVVNTNYRDRK